MIPWAVGRLVTKGRTNRSKSEYGNGTRTGQADRPKHSTPSTPIVTMMLSTQQLDAPALAFGVEVIETEHRLLSAGWHSPIRLHNAAADFELCGDSFADHKCGVVFRVLLACAVTNTEPTEELVHAVADREGAAFNSIADVTALHWQESSSAGVELWAKRLVDLRRRRERAHELLAEADALLRGGLGPSRLFLDFAEGLQQPVSIPAPTVTVPADVRRILRGHRTRHPVQKPSTALSTRFGPRYADRCARGTTR